MKVLMALMIMLLCVSGELETSRIQWFLQQEPPVRPHEDHNQPSEGGESGDDENDEQEEEEEEEDPWI